jgi:hypothetical protein
MKTENTTNDNNSQTFLTGAILFANVDDLSFTSYAIKAAIGGIIWMSFRLAGDFFSQQLLERKKRKELKETKEETKEVISSNESSEQTPNLLDQNQN